VGSVATTRRGFPTRSQRTTDPHSGRRGCVALVKRVRVCERGDGVLVLMLVVKKEERPKDMKMKMKRQTKAERRKRAGDGLIVLLFCFLVIFNLYLTEHDDDREEDEADEVVLEQFHL
jgi:hypothetical protein